jgi:hypothetical protein
MSNQQQSPLFRLPRELRDNIYEHYAHDDEGVFYDYASDTLRHADKSNHEERNALTRCCKQAAEEMRGVAMQANTITFFHARSDKDGICFHDLDSKAGRFERLVQMARRMRMHILHYVAKAGCVTPSMVDQVAARFPSMACYYRAVYAAIKDGRELYGQMATARSDWEWRWQTSATLCDAIEYTLDLASPHPRFDEATAEASVRPYLCNNMMPPFLSGSHKAVLGWKPERWLIPTEADLALESCLADSTTGKNSFDEADYPEPMVPVAWYFSATAVAIDFLKRLSRTERMRIRETIIIKEEVRGVAYTESH